MAANTGKPWTDEELEAAVFGYMLLLALQQSGVSYPVSEFYKLIPSGPLSKRNEVSVRFRLRNITHVMAELGLPTLTRFSAASQVGNKVRERLTNIILSYNDDPFFNPGTPKLPAAYAASDDHVALLKGIEELKAELANFNHSSLVGHNNPPEEIGDEDHTLDAISQLSARLAVLEAVDPNSESLESLLESEKNKIVSVVFALLNWGKNRITKFIDAALVTAAPILILKITETTPMIFDILSKIQKMMG